MPTPSSAELAGELACRFDDRVGEFPSIPGRTLELVAQRLLEVEPGLGARVCAQESWLVDPHLPQASARSLADGESWRIAHRSPCPQFSGEGSTPPTEIITTALALQVGGGILSTCCAPEDPTLASWDIRLRYPCNLVAHIEDARDGLRTHSPERGEGVPWREALGRGMAAWLVSEQGRGEITTEMWLHTERNLLWHALETACVGVPAELVLATGADAEFMNTASMNTAPSHRAEEADGHVTVLVNDPLEDVIEISCALAGERLGGWGHLQGITLPASCTPFLTHRAHITSPPENTPGGEVVSIACALLDEHGVHSITSEAFESALASARESVWVCEGRT